MLRLARNRRRRAYWKYNYRIQDYHDTTITKVEASPNIEETTIEIP